MCRQLTATSPDSDQAGQSGRRPRSVFPPADRILSTVLTRQAVRYGDGTLLVFGETRWSYAETARIAAASAARLMRAGIRAGDRVALICSNRPEFLEVYLGCAWMGAVCVPINTALRGIQLSHILRNSAPKLLVAEAPFMPAVATLESDVAPPGVIWTIGEGGKPSSMPGPIAPLPPLGEGVSPAQVRPGDTVAILYTSGTTGPSKGVCCPQAQMFWWGVYSARALGIVEGDVLFTTLPLFHTNALNAFYQAHRSAGAARMFRRGRSSRCC
ncbi:AMP-binding protein [Bradyrhizobium septentrionale]|uniref:AMP-binding protein n=1 Tax=Bradyrhizobium septentrionale TaxID=1404411 RepID=UPI001CD4A844|nr:AMP-binding protein [Bradyrhizobium septentrionale]UGY22139.1 AMP-binding protein [Bradyrhizobium septentrionale]